MAWVWVPDLAVHPAIQRYQHLRLISGGGAAVRYEGAHRGLARELTLDAQGFVLPSPDLARRVPPAGPVADTLNSGEAGG